MHRGSWKSSSSPRIAGVQWSSTLGSTLWGMAPGVAVILGIVHGLAEIAPASWRLQRAAWSLLWGVPSSRRGVAAFRGSYRPGSCPGQGRSCFRGSCHAVRGLRGRESTNEVWGVGSIVAGEVPSTSCTASRFPQCRHSVRNGGAVTGVGGRDSGHYHCGEWRPDVV